MERVNYIGIALLGIFVGELLNHLIKYLQGQGKLCSVLSTNIGGGKVRWYQYTYFLQYLLCKGKDKQKGAPLPKVYVLVGIANAFIYIGIYYVYKISVIGVIYGLCGSVLIILSVIDLRTFEIPIQLNVSILLLGLIRLGLDYENWLQYVIGFISVSGFLYLVLLLSTWILKKEGIGGGDIKLMAAAGLLLGWKLIVLSLMLGCILGSIIHVTIMAVKKGEQMLAFGPYLSLGIIIAMIWGEQLISWYLKLIIIS